MKIFPQRNRFGVNVIFARDEKGKLVPVAIWGDAIVAEFLGQLSELGPSQEAI